MAEEKPSVVSSPNERRIEVGQPPVEIPEKRREDFDIREREKGEAVPGEEAAPPPAPVSTTTEGSPTYETPNFTKQVESVLEEDMTDLFLRMTDSQKSQFKTKGEETARKIEELLMQAKVNARKIFILLREWLGMIPGVNKFFLEQEAKIKTDKLLLLVDARRKRAEQEIS